MLILVSKTLDYIIKRKTKTLNPRGVVNLKNKTKFNMVKELFVARSGVPKMYPLYNKDIV